MISALLALAGVAVAVGLVLVLAWFASGGEEEHEVEFCLPEIRWAGLDPSRFEEEDAVRWGSNMLSDDCPCCRPKVPVA